MSDVEASDCELVLRDPSIFDPLRTLSNPFAHSFNVIVLVFFSLYANEDLQKLNRTMRRLGTSEKHGVVWFVKLAAMAQADPLTQPGPALVMVAVSLSVIVWTAI